MKAVASVLCRILHIRRSVDPGVKYFNVGPTISARASRNKRKVLDFHKNVFNLNFEQNHSLLYEEFNLIFFIIVPF